MRKSVGSCSVMYTTPTDFSHIYTIIIYFLYCKGWGGSCLYTTPTPIRLSILLSFIFSLSKGLYTTPTDFSHICTILIYFLLLQGVGGAHVCTLHQPQSVYLYCYLLFCWLVIFGCGKLYFQYNLC